MRALILPVAVAALLLGLPLGSGSDRPAGERAAAQKSVPARDADADAAEPAPAGRSEPPRDADPAAPSEGEPTAATLRGPRATSPASKVKRPPSIVERGFDGRLTILAGEPEAHALRALDLTDAERNAVDAVMSRRIEFFDQLVQEHVLELQVGFAALARVESAGSGGERLAALSEFIGTWDSFRPWRDRGTVIHEIADAIPEPKRRAAQAMVVAYRAALARERARDRGLAPTNVQLQFELHLEAFGALLTESFERQEKNGNADFDRFSRALNLTPEQAERARVIFTDLYLKETRREATGWDRFQALGEFMKELSSEQRVRAWRFIRREGR